MGATLSRTVPEELTGLPDTGEFEFIGSAVSPSLSVAAYKTAFVPVDALNVAGGMLREAGWREFELRMSPSGGFVTGNQPQIELYCRDEVKLDVVASASRRYDLCAHAVQPESRRISVRCTAGRSARNDRQAQRSEYIRIYAYACAAGRDPHY